ncbi:MAG: prolipoprotein diacylglyceryl transferase [Armatimonadetes bacterium]|nr:prolipoprotein diacylglyceryl transferase [Armatimonadota bacterium]
MHPTLFKIGTFEIPTYGVILMVAFIVGLALARKRAAKFGFTPDQIDNVSFGLIICGILGARILFMIQEWPYFQAHPSEIYTLQMRGLTSFGGIIGGAIWLIYWCVRRRQSILGLMDLMAAPMLIGHVIGRVGCLMNGCCYGGPTTLPWGVEFNHEAFARHPAQLYDSLVNLGMLGLLFLFEKAPRKVGQSAGMFFMLHGASRIFYEFFRIGSSSTTIGGLPITDAQVAAGIFVLIGAVIFVRAARKPLPTSEAIPV